MNFSLRNGKENKKHQKVFQETNWGEKLEKFVAPITENDFGVIALLEVNQINNVPAADESRLVGFDSDGNQ